MRYLLALGLVVFLFGIPNVSFAASLFLSPAGGTYSVGERIFVKVLVSSNTSINAVSGALSFPTSIFSVEAVSKTSSIINFWASGPTYSNDTGTINFEGVALSGFHGDAGTVITITLHALKAGSGTISFRSGKVLANDGQGTDVTSTVSGGTFQIKAAKVSPKSPAPVVPSVPAPPVEVKGVPTVTTTSWGSVIYFCSALIALLGLLAGYFLWRRHSAPRRSMQGVLEKETKEAENALHTSFVHLEQDLAEHLRNKSISGKVDSKELEDIAVLKKDLSGAEELIDKKIKDIGVTHLDEKE